VPFVFAQVAAARTALALRQAAARCEAAADLPQSAEGPRPEL
jgi:hypothetical protein